MPRQPTLNDADLLARLGRVFADMGYAGASLSALSEATGLKKASLYHRFPKGKEQMAREVLAATGAWLNEHVVEPLRGDAMPEQRVRAMIDRLDDLYSGGKQACLLNMLSSAHIHEGPFGKEIRAMFRAFIDAVRGVLEDAGQDHATARRNAERMVMLLQGSLVLSRGMGTTKPFKDLLKRLPEELLGDAPTGSP